MTMTATIVSEKAKNVIMNDNQDKVSKPRGSVNFTANDGGIDRNLNAEALVHLGRLQVYHASELEERNKSNWTECKGIVKRLYPRW